MQTVGGRYALDGRLGEGGMGEVYRARHLQLGKPFALKLISPAFAMDSQARERFNQEAKLASEITHPNIVSVVDYGEDPEFGAYMVMELVEGEPLLSDSSPMTIRRALDVLGQIADALDHIHRRGIVHGDVKADNILLTAEPGGGARRRRIARLLDFGLARRSATGETVEEHISGSPHYLSPERATGGSPTVAADVYALGVLGYLLLAGRLPFVGGVVEVLMAQVHDDPPSLSELRGSEAVDPALESMVMRAMHKDPGQRHGSAAAFRYELNTVMDMLDIRRRSSGVIRTEPIATRETAIVAAFERSRMPQALCGRDGTVVQANKSFVAFVRDPDVAGRNLEATSLAAVVPSLMEAIRDVHTSGKGEERRAWVKRGDGRTSLELTIWISPLPMPGCEIHLLVRVDELAPASG